jgi:hypothetical protein
MYKPSIYLVVIIFLPTYLPVGPISNRIGSQLETKYELSWGSSTTE